MTSDTQQVAFGDLFLQLCECLDGRLFELTDLLGNYVDISEDENRAYVWFRNNAAFQIKNNSVKHLSIPIADAHGHPYRGSGEYYVLDGVKLGMTKEEVAKNWGEPTGKSNRAWGYDSKGFTTRRGVRVVIAVCFDEDETGQFRVHQFSARPQ